MKTKGVSYHLENDLNDLNFLHLAATNKLTFSVKSKELAYYRSWVVVAGFEYLQFRGV